MAAGRKVLNFGAFVTRQKLNSHKNRQQKNEATTHNQTTQMH
jgi:hypothetical protein